MTTKCVAQPSPAYNSNNTSTRKGVCKITKRDFAIRRVGYTRDNDVILARLYLSACNTLIIKSPPNPTTPSFLFFVPPLPPLPPVRAVRISHHVGSRLPKSSLELHGQCKVTLARTSGCTWRPCPPLRHTRGQIHPIPGFQR